MPVIRGDLDLMPRRVCLEPGCGHPYPAGSRCPNPECPRSRKRPHPPKAVQIPYGEKKRRAAAVREWVKPNGPICPGFGVPPHEVIVGTGTYLRTAGSRSLAAAIGAAVGYWATGWPIAALAGGGVAAAAPGMIRRSREERALLERREAIAEVSARLRDAIRSGIGIADALAHAAENAPPAIRSDLRRLVSEARVSGLPEAAHAFAERVSDPCADLLASALGTSERLGSRNLSELPDALAEATTAQAAAVREARARQTRNRMSARVVAAVPILLLLAIRRANPAYLAPFETASGQVVLAFALALIWAGYVAMRRAARIEGSAR